MNEFIEHNTIQFKSKCRPMYVLHSSKPFFTLMDDFINGTEQPSMTPNALRYAVHRQTISWLIRHDGFIFYKEWNTSQSQSHPCLLQLFHFWEQVQLIVCIIVRTLKDGFPKQHPVDSFQHFFIPNESNDSNRLILSISCDPFFTVMENSKFEQCMEFTKQMCIQGPPIPTETIISSWFIRTGCAIYCKPCAQDFIVDYYVADSHTEETATQQTLFPVHLRPYLSLLQQLFASQYKPNVSNSPTLPTPTNNQSSSTNSLPEDSGKKEISLPHEIQNQSTPKKNQSKGSPKKSPTGTHSYSTRHRTSTVAKLLQSASRSKLQISYPDRRHQPGKPPLLMTPPKCGLHIRMLEESIVEKRLSMLSQMIAFHEELQEKGFFAPRDKWTSWLDCQHDPSADRPFMILMTICMSSSTSDLQLSSIMPRLFAFCLTSAMAVIEIAQQYGMDALCSIFSESGRYYQNTERIVNAADYFCQRHHGKIPNDITIYELTTLYGIGYKTACIVIKTAFQRVDSIPSDIHVIRWSEHLGWVPKGVTGCHVPKFSNLGCPLKLGMPSIPSLARSDNIPYLMNHEQHSYRSCARRTELISLCAKQSSP